MKVTDVPGAKPVPWTANAVSAGPSLLFTMHRPGPGAAWDVPHTVCGAAGRGGGAVAGLPELVSEAPRMTPPTTRAAPTETQPTQAICVLTHRCHRGQVPGPGSGRCLGLGR